MARRRSSVRMQARPAPKSGMVVMGLILAAFVGVMILVLVVRQKQKAREYVRRKQEKEFRDDAIELTNGLAAMALRELPGMKKGKTLPDEAWASFQAYRSDGLVDALIQKREKMETFYVDGACSRGTAPKLETGESSKSLQDNISMSRGQVTLGGKTTRVRVFRKPVMNDKGEALGTVILVMEPPGR